MIKVSKILRAWTQDPVTLKLITQLESWMQGTPVLTKPGITHILTKEIASQLKTQVPPEMVDIVINEMLEDGTLEKVEAYEYNHQLRHARKKS